MTPHGTPDKPIYNSLQAEAEAYQNEYQILRKSLEEIYVKRKHNRAWELNLIARMHARGVEGLQVGRVLLRPNLDGKGFDRIALPEPARPSHA